MPFKSGIIVAKISMLNLTRNYIYHIYYRTEKSNTLHLKILRSNDEYYFKKEYNFPFKMKKITKSEFWSSFHPLKLDKEFAVETNKSSFET